MRHQVWAARLDLAAARQRTLFPSAHPHDDERDGQQAKTAECEANHGHGARGAWFDQARGG